MNFNRVPAWHLLFESSTKFGHADYQIIQMVEVDHPICSTPYSAMDDGALIRNFKKYRWALNLSASWPTWKHLNIDKFSFYQSKTRFIFGWRQTSSNQSIVDQEYCIKYIWIAWSIDTNLYSTIFIAGFLHYSSNGSSCFAMPERRVPLTNKNCDLARPWLQDKRGTTNNCQDALR